MKKILSRRGLLGGVLLLCALLGAAEGAEPKHLLLLGQGPDGHPPGTHEYAGGLKVLAAVLQNVPDLKVTTRDVPAKGGWQAGPQALSECDGVVLFLAEGARWIASDAALSRAFAELAAREGGFVALHWALGTRDAKYIPEFVALLGACHGGPDRRYRVTETTLSVSDAGDPITRGIDDFQIRDEFYYRLKFLAPAGRIVSLVQAQIEGESETVAWRYERPDGGRSGGFSGLHFHENWRRAEYRKLVAQAVVWTLKLPIPPDGLNVDVPESVYVLDTKQAK